MTADRKARTIQIEVVYALRDRQALLAVEMEEGGTVGRAIQRSGILGQFPEIDFAQAKVGIFGKTAALDTPVRDGDRVEIHRPLIADPKQARRDRTRKANSKR